MNGLDIKNAVNEYVEYLKKEIEIREGKIEPDNGFFDINRYDHNPFIQRRIKVQIDSLRDLIDKIEEDEELREIMAIYKQ